MPVGGGGLTGSPGGLTWTLQADFSGTAFGGTPTWTDITAYWMSSPTDPGGAAASIPSGRQDQATTVEGATTSFVLNNSDGRFTPGKSSSPYYPNVRRHVRMRLIQSDGTTTQTVVDGLVDTWDVTPQVDGPTLSTAAITDPFGRLSASTTLRAMVVEQMLTESPNVLLPLDEAAGSSTAGDITATGVPTATVTKSKINTTASSYTFGADNGMGGTGLHLVGSGTDGYGLKITGLDPSKLYAIEFSFSTTASVFQHVYEEGSYLLSMNASGQITLGGAVTPGSYNDGQPHQALGRAWNLLGQVHSEIFVDGVSVATGVAGGSLVGDTEGYLGGGVSTVGRRGVTTQGPFFTGTIWNFARWAALPDVATHYSAAKTALAGESTSARWTRLLSYRPNIGGTSVGTVGTVGSEDTAGQSVGDALTAVAVAEGGVVDTSRGTLRLIGRTGLRNPAPAVTLDAALGQVDLPSTWRDDAQGFTNDVSVSRPNGATQRATNASSITADGSAQTPVTANVNSDRDAADMAGWMVAVGTQEAITSPTLTVNLYARADSALTLAVCALKTYDVVKLINLPASAPASTMYLQVQGGTLTVGASECSVQLFTTAKPPQVLQVKTVADSTTALDAGNLISW